MEATWPTITNRNNDGTFVSRRLANRRFDKHWFPDLHFGGGRATFLS